MVIHQNQTLSCAFLSFLIESEREKNDRRRIVKIGHEEGSKRCVLKPRGALMMMIIFIQNSYQKNEQWKLSRKFLKISFVWIKSEVTSETKLLSSFCFFVRFKDDRFYADRRCHAMLELVCGILFIQL